MNQWIETKEFMTRTGLKKAGACKAIADKRWKKQPLTVRKEKNPNGGRDLYKVLWDTETNLPATGDNHANTTDRTRLLHPAAATLSANVSRSDVIANGAQNDAGRNQVHGKPSQSFAELNQPAIGEQNVEYQSNREDAQTGKGNFSQESMEKTAAEKDVQGKKNDFIESVSSKNRSVVAASLTQLEPTSSNPLADKEVGTFLGESNNVIPLIQLLATNGLAISVQEPSARYESESRPTEPNPVLATQTQATILDDKKLDVIAIEPEPDDFETLLLRFLLKKPKPSQKVLRCKLRKEFKETGVIPSHLYPENSPLYKKRQGQKTKLEPEIVTRFVEMVKASADKKSPNFVTHSLRKVSNFHYELEQEFDRKIKIMALYQVVKSQKLKGFFEKQDDDVELTKAQSFFPALPALDTVQMDGVQTDFFAIRKNDLVAIQSSEDCRFVDCIEFYDHGSRRLMAMHGYFGESNENSVDIFNRFLAGNEFTQTTIKIRPDNAKGFLNLKRCIRAINDAYARPDGFMFIDDFARAGTPKDKAHLESSHKAFHQYEHHVITHYKRLEKVVGTFEKRKKMNDGSYKIITCTMIDITLDEFNASGLLDGYVTLHNGKRHRFTENGIQKSWIPNDKYEKHLQMYPTFRFTEECFESNRIYGYTKQAATVSKEGLITYQQKIHGKFSVEKFEELFSSHRSTDVKISLVDKGKLAVFANEEDGPFLCFAYALKAPVVPQKVIDAIEVKREKAVAGGAYKAICQQFELIGLPINEVGLKELIEQGLTLEMTATIIANDNSVKFGDGSDKSNRKRWFYFVSGAKESLQGKGTTLSRNTM